MSKATAAQPVCVIIAGPNGAGKTTFAREFLPKDANSLAIRFDGNRTMNTKNASRDPKAFAASVGRALRRASQTARKTARAYGTPIYLWKNGKVVAEKP